jgi:hypothetical protein
MTAPVDRRPFFDGLTRALKGKQVGRGPVLPASEVPATSESNVVTPAGGPPSATDAVTPAPATSDAGPNPYLPRALPVGEPPMNSRPLPLGLPSSPQVLPPLAVPSQQ